MTSSPPLSPALRKALAFLDQRIQATTPEDDGALPSIAAMGRLAGVSLVTMWKAVSILKQRGVLAGSRGHPTYIPREDVSHGHGDGTAKGSRPTRMAWRTVRSRVEWDILNGVFARGGRLPSQKELINRYGTSFRTLSAALRSLAADRVIAAQGRGYRARALAHQHGRPRVVMLGLTSPAGEFLMGDLDRAVMSLLESECARCGIDLDIIGFSRDSTGGLRFSHFQRGVPAPHLRDAPEILGYLLLAIHPDSAPEEVLRLLLSYRKPVAVLDELGEYTFPASFRDDAAVRFFTMTASSLPGRIAARFCLARGHRIAAFISPYHHYLFSRQRNLGVADTYRSAGTECRALSFTHHELGMPEFDMRSRQRVDTRRIRDHYRVWRSSLTDLYARAIDRRISEVGGLTLVQAEVAEYSQDLFEAALRERSATVWIVANDFTAGLALDFLADHNVRVPGEVAVMGFDNTFEALKRGITSYDFNVTAVAGAMLQYLIRPKSLSAFRNRRIIEIEGSVVGRRTA